MTTTIELKIQPNSISFSILVVTYGLKLSPLPTAIFIDKIMLPISILEIIFIFPFVSNYRAIKFIPREKIAWPWILITVF